MSRGEQVKLVTMKQYTLEKLSSNGAASNSNGDEAGYEYITPLVSNGNGASQNGSQNGFIPNKEYGDWDSSSPPSPTQVASAVPPRLQSRPSSGGKPKQKFIPEREIDIPKDGSLYDFTADDIATFLRHLGIEERIVSHVQKKGLDGAKFSKLKDSDLEALSMNNPIICHFRDKSVKGKSSGKKKAPFML